MVVVKLGLSRPGLSLRSSLLAQGFLGRAGLDSLHCFALCAVLGASSLGVSAVSFDSWSRGGCCVKCVVCDPGLTGPEEHV